MKPWPTRIQEATSTEEICRLLPEIAAPRQVLFRAVAQHAQVWDESLLLLVLAEGRGIRELPRNRHLPEWAKAALSEWCVRRLETEEGEAELPGISETLQLLLRRPELAVGSPLFQRLLRLSDPKSPARPVAWRTRLALRVLLVHPGMTPELLLEMKPRMSLHSLAEQFTDLVRSPHVSPAVISLLLDSTRDFTSNMAGLNHLLEKRRLRRNPEIRAALLRLARRKNMAVVYQGLIADVEEDAVDLLYELARVAPQAAGQSLLQHKEALLPRLTPTDLQPLLEAESQETRLAAITLLGQLSESPTPEARRRKA